MARVIDFASRDVRDAQAFDPTDKTPTALYDAYAKVSFETLDTLLGRLKSTGKWNEATDRLMQQVLNDINAICLALAGSQDNGQTT